MTKEEYDKLKKEGKIKEDEDQNKKEKSSQQTQSASG